MNHYNFDENEYISNVLFCYGRGHIYVEFSYASSLQCYATIQSAKLYRDVIVTLGSEGL